MKGNYIDTDEITDLEDGMKKLKENIASRNKMGGAMYWNIINDDCSLIANKCLELGGDRTEINSLLKEGAEA